MIAAQNIKTLFFVLYDGIGNSVFESQVLQPLLKRIENGLYHRITLISFETNRSLVLPHSLQQATQITLILLPKTKFLGIWSLASMIKQFAVILQKEESNFDIIARGQIAGYLMIKASVGTACTQRTIQIRGLLAEEYRYTHAHATGLKKLIHYLRFKHYDCLEKKVYTLAQQYNAILEAVSNPLKKYLVENYKVPVGQITISEHDTPEALSLEQKNVWRKEIRQQLGIDYNAYVYCYNGSAKAWQCPEKVIEYFQACTKKNSIPTYLVILSQEPNSFTSLIKKANINPELIRLCSVPHANVFRYLAACDEGIVIRESHILNWVSRPTKVLEYQAAHLAITHNNTIGILTTTTNQPASPITDLLTIHPKRHTNQAD